MPPSRRTGRWVAVPALTPYRLSAYSILLVRYTANSPDTHILGERAYLLTSARLSRGAAKHREETKAEEKRQQEARRAERERAKEDDLKRTVFQSRVANGGAPTEFEAAWPELKAEILERHALEKEDEARKLQQASGVSRI